MQDLLAPPRCAGCSTLGAALCRECRVGIARPPEGLSFPPLRRVLVPWSYVGAARSLVLDLKLRGRRVAAEPLVEAMLAEVARTGLAGETITWVPGRRTDIRRRGFDHARVLAEGVAESLGLPPAALLTSSPRRTDQTGLAAAARRANLRDAFRCEVASGGIVLVDDVVTTGATVRACAEALLHAGAAFVEVVAACRA